MGKKVEDDVFADSQYAIRDYIHLKKENDNMHEARVLVRSDGEIKYNDTMKVVSKIDNNESFVNIIGNDNFEQNYFEKYSNYYQVFTFNNGILSIKGQDRLGNAIEINIISL